MSKHVYMRTHYADMRVGDRVTLEGYKTPFEVTSIDGDCITCVSKRAGTLRVHSTHYYRIVDSLKDAIR